QGKAFQHMMAIFDPAFQVSSNITCKNLVAEAYENSVKKVKALIMETYEFATITVDL
ncbi:8446_t:CDS:1, partial [Acaulospora morrowiae]